MYASVAGFLSASTAYVSVGKVSKKLLGDLGLSYPYLYEIEITVSRAPFFVVDIKTNGKILTIAPWLELMATPPMLISPPRIEENSVRLYYMGTFFKVGMSFHSTAKITMELEIDKSITPQVTIRLFPSTEIYEA